MKNYKRLNGMALIDMLYEMAKNRNKVDNRGPCVLYLLSGDPSVLDDDCCNPMIEVDRGFLSNEEMNRRNLKCYECIRKYLQKE